MRGNDQHERILRLLERKKKLTEKQKIFYDLLFLLSHVLQMSVWLDISKLK